MDRWRHLLSSAYRQEQRNLTRTEPPSLAVNTHVLIVGEGMLWLQLPHENGTTAPTALLPRKIASSPMPDTARPLPA